MYRSSVIRVLETGYLDETRSAALECKRILEAHGYKLAKQLDVEPIMSNLKDAIYTLTRETGLVVILGGTGLLSQDISPEALLSIIDKRATGLEVAMIHSALKHDPGLALYRCTAGTILNSVVLCIPGFVESVSWLLEPILDSLKVLIDQLNQEDG
ncbi:MULTISPECIES: molybdenum cofactor biosynthesis protein B [Kosmotoga]|jgi:molybdopterin biosynthesis enzyme MoaB|uniref:Molybdopterin binding domain protein n=1 Tax=Kosmotoga olearia (strain ATCC BAA-1733 / DSM 21960 / TBF 19.5.1) TaxID=521045 RepID=C5CFE4_KOSOT|nr:MULTISPECIES: molybdopterin-binding protein [Kosmotoga]ACR80353.1 molybdopterin binding domain protein [Kosmotoga olearia TBF 19.5.1]MDI3523788.1 hypothetical protein [Kosmotoga sp.]MDK2953332.1 hypothetical protein [Kosmotoga sp.]